MVVAVLYGICFSFCFLFELSIIGRIVAAIAKIKGFCVIFCDINCRLCGFRCFVLLFGFLFYSKSAVAKQAIDFELPKSPTCSFVVAVMPILSQGIFNALDILLRIWSI